MEVRLAYRRGLLSRRAINWTQFWSLQYLYYMEHRDKAKVEERFHKNFAAINSPDRYMDLFAKPENQHQVESEPMTDEDIDKIEEYLAGLGDARSLTADQAPSTKGEWI